MSASTKKFYFPKFSTNFKLTKKDLEDRSG